MALFSIKDLEHLSGIKAHTLRIWEQRYEILKPQRTDTNIRYYDDEQLKNILNICTLNRNGYKISHIARMSPDELRQEALRLQENPDPDSVMDSLINAMVDFSEERFERVLNRAIQKLGFEQAFTSVVFPLMERTGVLWATGVIRPSQEHFITNLIRRKITVAIDGQDVRPNDQSRKFVLYLPEGETHELLLLFSEYILRKQNQQVVYIGNSLPFEDLYFLRDTFKPDYFLSFITVPTREMPVGQYLQRLSSAFPGIRILVGGAQMRNFIGKVGDNIQPVLGLSDLINICSEQ